MKKIEVLDPPFQPPTDEEVNAALSLLQRDYYAEVRAIVRDLQERFNAGEFDSVDDVEDDIHQTIDGHQYVIYTTQNYMVMLSSNTTIDEALEDLGMEPTTDTAQIAYAILYHDVHELLGTVGDYAEWFEEDEDSDEEQAQA